MLQKLIRRHQVEDVTGLGRSAIYALMAQGEFPRPIRISQRAVAWRESDIAEWIEQRSTKSGVS